MSYIGKHKLLQRLLTGASIRLERWGGGHITFTAWDNFKPVDALRCNLGSLRGDVTPSQMLVCNAYLQLWCTYFLLSWLLYLNNNSIIAS